MSSRRPDPHTPSAPPEGADPAAAAGPVNPGAWDTRSWTLVDATDGPPAEAGPESLGGFATADDGAAGPYGETAGPAGWGDAAQVVWPEADHAEAPALDADGVPLAEPPTGPVRTVPSPAGTTAPPGPLRQRRPPAPEPAGGASSGGLADGRDAAPGAGSPPRRRASATPRTAPRPAPPAPGTRLPYPDAPAGGEQSGPPRGGGLRRGAAGPEGAAGEGDAADVHDPRHAPPVPGSRVPVPGAAHAAGPVPPARGGAQRARAGSAGPGSAAAGAKRVGGGFADPVRELMHRHRALCEQAVDPLEIAAGLESHGITDRTAARYRHRDVFSLAEELYVRVPRADSASPAAGPAAGGAAGADRAAGGRRTRGVRAVGRALSHLLPGALCAATLAGLAYVPQTPPYARPAVGVLGALTVLAAVRLSLRGVPRTRTAGLWACWLLGYVLYGDWLLTRLLTGEARGEQLVPALNCLCVPLALAFGVAPAAWCAQLFAARARRLLTGSRSLGDFAAGVRPLLLLTVALFTCALLAVQGAAHVAVEGVAPPHATQAATAALGVLLFAALLLGAHGFPRAASAGLAAACLLVAAALGSVLAARLPGMAGFGRPVETAVAAYGPTVVPVLACAGAALALLAYALRVLTGASAHQGRQPAPSRPARQGR